MRTHCVPERLVVRHSHGIEGRKVEVDEPLALLLGDLAMTMHVDQMLESKFTAEAVGATERLSGEPGQVLDVLRLNSAEQWLQKRVCEHTRIKVLLEPVQGFHSAGVLEQALVAHVRTLPGDEEMSTRLSLGGARVEVLPPAHEPERHVPEAAPVFEEIEA